MQLNTVGYIDAEDNHNTVVILVERVLLLVGTRKGFNPHYSIT